MPTDDAPSTPAYARMRETLRAEILGGAWRAGEHRTLSALATRYRVSISPVREALLGLEGEGLVEMRQHRGAVVPLLDAAMLGDLYDLRGAIGSLFARRAAERAGADLAAALVAAEEGYAAAASRGAVAEALRHNDAFHGVIIAAADCPQAASVYRARTEFVNTARRRLGFGPGRVEEAVAQHRAIREAVVAGEAEAAARAAFAHSMSAKRDLIARLSREGSGP